MKAKACTKCRQWKARCNYDTGEDSCGRCRSLNLTCIFDTTFKRVSKTKSIQRMSTEIQRLQHALEQANANTNNLEVNKMIESNESTLIPTDWSSQHSDLNHETIERSDIQDFCQQPDTNTNDLETMSETYRTTDNTVTLTPAQVNEYFRTYFNRCHRHLPFKMTTHSPDLIYSKCQVLFWVICAAAASWTLRTQLAPSIKTMLESTIHSPPRSIEKVQALLIMSMWPFSVQTTMHDASDFYCGLATQMALHIGLHRPNQSHLHHLGSEELVNSNAVDYEVKITTWLACFVVSQRQAQVRGVPQSICVDHHLLDAFDRKVVDPGLSQLCHIYHIMMQANLVIGAEASTPSGMLEPTTRMSAIKLWMERFSQIEKEYKQMNDVVRTAFLSSRMQISSFALLDDMPISPELLEYVESAKKDAYDLIELYYSQNLAMSPAHVRHAISYSGFVLVKILRSGFITESEVLKDNIEKVRQALSTTTNSLDDTYRKACQTIQSLLYVEDKKLLPPIYTRMSASLVYDLMRICAEHKFAPNSDIDEQITDLEGFDWNFLECIQNFST